jgi:hypothetical protein
MYRKFWWGNFWNIRSMEGENLAQDIVASLDISKMRAT